MKPSPCLHPIQIRTPKGKLVTVPCGKCAACVVNKGRLRTSRLEDYLIGYPFQFFLTLTFEDEFLPRAFYNETNDTIYSDSDCDYDGVVYSQSLSDFTQEDRDFVFSQIDKFGFLPVLSHSVLIKFKKRFRYYFSKLGSNYEDIFIYGCGELGPSTYRPHYHLIFGFKSDVKTSVFEKCCRDAWSVSYQVGSEIVRRSLGFITTERVSKRGCESYVAKYINCLTNLPKIYAVGKFRPFACGSNRVDSLLLRLSQTDVRKVFNNPTYEVVTNRHGSTCSEPVPSSYLNRFFPRICRFNYFSRFELYRLYSLCKYYSDPKRAYDDFEERLDQVVEWNQLLERNSPFDGRQTSVIPRSVLQMCVDIVAFRDVKGNYIDDPFIRKRNFMRLWYVSRIVCNNALKLDIPVSTYVDKIVDYYIKSDFLKLKQFYEFQNELIDDIVNPQPLGAIYSLYYNSDPLECDMSYYSFMFGWHGEKLEDIPCQCKYEELSSGILKDTTKTKKRNDYCFSKGSQPAKYRPRLSPKINKFLTN